MPRVPIPVRRQVLAEPDQVGYFELVHRANGTVLHASVADVELVVWRGILRQVPASVRHGPYWNHWKANVTIDILDDLIISEIVRSSLQAAGQKKGAGANRNNGFGRFQVTRFEVSD